MTKRDLPWVAIGIILAAGWWGYQISLPPVFRGITCCDSLTYMTQARMVVRPVNDPIPPPALRVDRPADGAATGTPAPWTASAGRSRLQQLLLTLFRNTAAQPPGYPVFLASSILIGNLTGGALPWIALSLFIALFLHIASALTFVAALRWAKVSIPGWVIAWMIALPAMGAHAAAPLSDSLATSVLLFALAGTVWVTRAHKNLWAIVVGLLWAYLLWTRSSHLPAVALFLGILLLVHGLRKFRGTKNAFLPLGILCASLVVGFLPRIVACTEETGGLCITPGAVAQKNAAILLHEGLRGARTYTVIQPLAGGMILTIPDGFFAGLQPSCDIGLASARDDLVRCLAAQWWKMPWFAVEKLFGLFDQSHINPHATYVTPPFLRWTLRIVTLPALVGFMGLLAFLALRIVRRKISARDILLFGYFPLHAASILPLSIEQRYGLPFLGIGLVGFGLVCSAWRRADRNGKAGIGLAALAVSAAFLTVTAAWDAHDPVPYVPISTAATTESLAPYQDIIQTVRVKY